VNIPALSFTDFYWVKLATGAKAANADILDLMPFLFSARAENI